MRARTAALARSQKEDAQRIAGLNVNIPRQVATVHIFSDAQYYSRRDETQKAVSAIEVRSDERGRCEQ